MAALRGLCGTLACFKAFSTGSGLYSPNVPCGVPAPVCLCVQMVVVLDCRGGSSMGLTRHMGLLKRLAVTLNQHYPVRGRATGTSRGPMCAGCRQPAVLSCTALCCPSSSSNQAHQEAKLHPPLLAPVCYSLFCHCIVPYSNCAAGPPVPPAPAGAAPAAALGAPCGHAAAAPQHTQVGGVLEWAGWCADACTPCLPACPRRVLQPQGGGRCQHKQQTSTRPWLAPALPLTYVPPLPCFLDVQQGGVEQYQ